MDSARALDESATRLLDKLRRACGPIMLAALEDPGVVNVELNPDGQLWVQRLGDYAKPVTTLTPERAHSIIASVATYMGGAVNASAPRVDGEFPLDGSRFAGLLPPTVRRPSFAIRKRASRVFSLDEYVAQGIMTAWQADVLKHAVRDRRNILIAGGTNSGKTTLGNAILDQVAKQTPQDRVVILEDTPELQCPVANVVPKLSSPADPLAKLVVGTLRWRPDRIVVGEVREPATATQLLTAWNTGHQGGLCTVHANGPLEALWRLDKMLLEQHHIRSPQSVLWAVNLIVFIEEVKEKDGSHKRRVTSIAVLDGVTKDQEYLITELRPNENQHVSSEEVATD